MRTSANLRAGQLVTTRLRAAAEELACALEKRDAGLAAFVADETFDLSPKGLADAAGVGELEQFVRPWIEAWDDVLVDWWFARDGGEAHWRTLLLPERGGFPHKKLLLNAFWLRLVGSPRAGQAQLPTKMAGRPLSEQARALGRFIVRADGIVPVDYARLHAELAPELRPVLAYWALAVHLVSPLTHIDDLVRANRAALSKDFAHVHARFDTGLAGDMMLSQCGYRSVYFDPEPRAFVEALSERVIRTGFEPFVRRTREDRQIEPTGSGGVGALLTTWGEHHAVRRSIEPSLTTLRAAGMTTFVPEADRATVAARIGPEWSGGNVELVTQKADSLPELGELANNIRERDLDVLIYPEVGLTNASRWLSTQRLARVQLTTYGHPVTTGSSAIDYFVGGELLEDGSAEYSERLVLLPGLGCSTTTPPAPPTGRIRPIGDRMCRFASLASSDKLTSTVLRTWDSILDGAPPQSDLELFAGVHGARARSFAMAIGDHLTPGRVTLIPTLDRLECLNRLQEADVALDAFPYTGFNSTVDALSVGVPVVTLAGRGPYGCASAALLRLMEVDEFTVAHDREGYIELARRLATDPGLRRELHARLTRERLVAAIADPELGDHFAAAVDWMRKNGPPRPGPPVLIRAGEAPRTVWN